MNRVLKREAEKKYQYIAAHVFCNSCFNEPEGSIHPAIPVIQLSQLINSGSFHSTQNSSQECYVSIHTLDYEFVEHLAS